MCFVSVIVTSEPSKVGSTEQTYEDVEYLNKAMRSCLIVYKIQEQTMLYYMTHIQEVRIKRKKMETIDAQEKDNMC